MRRALLSSMTAEDAESVARRLVSLAKHGSIRAMRLLCELTDDLGSAAVSVDVVNHIPREVPSKHPIDGEAFRRVIAELATMPALAKADPPKPGDNGDAPDDSDSSPRGIMFA